MLIIVLPHYWHSLTPTCKCPFFSPAAFFKFSDDYYGEHSTYGFAQVRCTCDWHLPQGVLVSLESTTAYEEVGRCRRVEDGARCGVNHLLGMEVTDGWDLVENTLTKHASVARRFYHITFRWSLHVKFRNGTEYKLYPSLRLGKLLSNRYTKANPPVRPRPFLKR